MGWRRVGSEREERVGWKCEVKSEVRVGWENYMREGWESEIREWDQRVGCQNRKREWVPE